MDLITFCTGFALTGFALWSKIEATSAYLRRTPIKRIDGNMTGLKDNQIHRLQHIYRRKVPAQQIVTQELARYLCELSLEINRQIGVLIDRKGIIEHVVVGDHKSIFLPDLGRSRVAANRLRGLRY